jgi:hypothetical protein
LPAQKALEHFYLRNVVRTHLNDILLFSEILDPPEFHNLPGTDATTLRSCLKETYRLSLFH